jgi:hypothetical protein
MRDKNQLQYPYRKSCHEVPVEAHPMQMGLRQRRIVPIEITKKMTDRHIHPRHERPS